MPSNTRSPLPVRMPRVDAHSATAAVPQLNGWVPDWPVPARVHAFMTTRTGGVSAAPFDSFNLGSHVHDDPAAVQHNRQLLARHLGTRPVFLNQVHGNGCVTLSANTPDGTVADACFTPAAGVACTVMVADCLPILLADAQGRAVAAVHAGWRGLAGAAGEGGVLAQIVKHFRALSLDVNASDAMLSSDSSDVTAAGASTAQDGRLLTGVMAWLGPCIGPTAFEVGDDVRTAFTTHATCPPGTAACLPVTAACFRPVANKPGKYLCDLARLARLQLATWGVTEVYGNDGSSPWCTVSQPATWFSHRRDAAPLGSTGRMAACVWLG